MKVAKLGFYDPNLHDSDLNLDGRTRCIKFSERLWPDLMANFNCDYVTLTGRKDRRRPGT